MPLKQQFIAMSSLDSCEKTYLVINSRFLELFTVDYSCDDFLTKVFLVWQIDYSRLSQ